MEKVNKLARLLGVSSKDAQYILQVLKNDIGGEHDNQAENTNE